MKYNSTKIIKTSLGILIIGFCIVWILYGEYKMYSIDKHYKLTTGVVNHIAPPGYKNYTRAIQHDYYVDGIKYNGEIGVKVCDNYELLDLSFLIVNKRFPVAYDTTNKSSSIIILTKKSAERFNCILTDTLLHYDSILNCEKVVGSY